MIFDMMVHYMLLCVVSLVHYLFIPPKGLYDLESYLHDVTNRSY
jgi:hypothetical protein